MRFGQMRGVAKSSDQQMVNLPAVYAIREYGTVTMKRWVIISALAVIVFMLILPLIEVIIA